MSTHSLSYSKGRIETTHFQHFLQDGLCLLISYPLLHYGLKLDSSPILFYRTDYVYSFPILFKGRIETTHFQPFLQDGLKLLISYFILQDRLKYSSPILPTGRIETVHFLSCSARRIETTHLLSSSTGRIETTHLLFSYTEWIMLTHLLFSRTD